MFLRGVLAARSLRENRPESVEFWLRDASPLAGLVIFPWRHPS
jgi:hypothetical protein